MVMVMVVSMVIVMVIVMEMGMLHACDSLGGLEVMSLVSLVSSMFSYPRGFH